MPRAGGNGHGGGQGNANANAADKADDNTGTDKSGKDKAGASNHGVPASSLGKLNAAHASPQGLAHAAPNSTVGQLNAYSEAMQKALAIEDPVARSQAIAQARSILSQTANKPVNTQVIGKVDTLLGLNTEEAKSYNDMKP